MSYLGIARSALSACEKSEKRRPRQTSGQSEGSSGCEISEICEKSPATNEIPALLTPDQAEALKGQIIAAVTAEPTAFDRARYEALTARWEAHERALARQGSPSDRIGAEAVRESPEMVVIGVEASKPSPSNPHTG